MTTTEVPEIPAELAGHYAAWPDSEMRRVRSRIYRDQPDADDAQVAELLHDERLHWAHGQHRQAQVREQWQAKIRRERTCRSCGQYAPTTRERVLIVGEIQMNGPAKGRIGGLLCEGCFAMASFTFATRAGEQQLAGGRTRAQAVADWLDTQETR